jgi:hypothetical protein
MFINLETKNKTHEENFWKCNLVYEEIAISKLIDPIMCVLHSYFEHYINKGGGHPFSH